MGLSIRARFPLGVFYGASPDGQAVKLPDPARLHAALVNAAGTGSLAESGPDGGLALSEDAMTALSWMEDHAPTAMEIPDHVWASIEKSVDAWRHEGVLEGKRKSSPSRVVKLVERKTRKTQDLGCALAGDIGWHWNGHVPQGVVDTIRRLCEDVPCLGETASPVVLEVGAIEATHVAVTESQSVLSRLRPGEVRLATPIQGRLRELQDSHRQRRPKDKLPTTQQDNASSSAKPSAAATPRSRIGLASYVPLETQTNLPWVAAMRLTLNRSVPREERIRWAVAVHRALISILDKNAGHLVTGHVPVGISPPPNRIAIQYLEQDSPSLLLLIPRVATLEDLGNLRDAVAQLKRNRIRHSGGLREIREVEEITTGDFWPQPHPPERRYWRPDVALVADAGRRKGTPLEMAALVAVGFVFRDQLGEVTGPRRYERLAEAVEARGVRVFDIARIPDSRIERYVHKVQAGVVPQPFTATFDLADLVPERALFALGQSRHLGGGLMRPVDMKEPTWT